MVVPKFATETRAQQLQQLALDVRGKLQMFNEVLHDLKTNDTPVVLQGKNLTISDVVRVARYGSKIQITTDKDSLFQYEMILNGERVSNIK